MGCVSEVEAKALAAKTAESAHPTADDKDASKEAAGAESDNAPMYSGIVEESSVTRPPPLEDRMHSPAIQEKQPPVMAEAALAQMEAMHEQEATAEQPLLEAIDRAVTPSKGPTFTATLTVNDLAPLPTQEDLAELVPLLPEMALEPVPAAKLASEAPEEAEAAEPAPSIETVQQAVVRDCEEQEEVPQKAALQKVPFELTMMATSTMPASTAWGRPPAMRKRQAGVPLSLARRALRRVPKKLFQEEARLLLWSGNGHFLLECLRYLLAADFGTAPELFRTVVSRGVTAASAGLEDLDELLRRAYAALPLEALAALWAAAVEEVGLCSDGRAAAGYRLNYTQFSQAFFKSMPGGSSPAVAAVGSPQPGSATAQTLTASFKTLRRDFQHDRHRRPPSPWNSRSPRPLVTKGKPPKEPRPELRSFTEALAFLVQGTDEGAVRFGLQLGRSRACCKVLHMLFEVRDRDRHQLLFGKEDHDEDDEEELLHDRQDEMAGKKMTRQDREEAQKLALRQKMRGSEMDFVNFSKDWHHVKSAPGPPCVIVEYPQGAGDLDWQQDVQVQEFSEWRYIHKLVDGVPTTSYEECTDLIVVAVREDGPAQRRGVRDGYKLMSIGMRMGWWASPRLDTDDWLQSIRRIQTLAFEPCDPTAPTGPLPLLIAAAGGEKRGKEDQMAFARALRRFGDGKERHALERAMWEGVTAMVCSTNDGATREQAHLAVQMAGHPPPLADGAVDGMALEALPVFHHSTLRVLEEAYSCYSRTVFMVPNWYFGNRYVDSLVSDQLFHDLPPDAYNVVRERVKPMENEIMVRHGLSCLQYLASRFPDMKFIFWCMARRTLIPNHTSTVPLDGQYLQVSSRFRNNTLDVLQYSDRDTFTRQHMKDNNGHPKRQGYDLIFRLIESIVPCVDKSLFDGLLDTEIESLPPPEPISPRLLDTTQSLLTSSSQGRIYKPHMRTRVAFCKVCDGRGHTADAPHLVHQEHLPPCNRRLPSFWGGTCGGHGHLPWQCPGLLQDNKCWAPQNEHGRFHAWPAARARGANVQAMAALQGPESSLRRSPSLDR
ncbi:ccnl1, partial [Symbiodinium microadriaticum]